MEQEHGPEYNPPSGVSKQDVAIDRQRISTRFRGFLRYSRRRWTEKWDTCSPSSLKYAEQPRKYLSSWANPPLGAVSNSVLSREPSNPEYPVGSAEFPRAAPALLTEDISIIGYTDSFRIKGSKALSDNEDKLPNGFSAPEILFGFKGQVSSGSLGTWLHHLSDSRRSAPLSFFLLDASPAEASREDFKDDWKPSHHLCWD